MSNNSYNIFTSDNYYNVLGLKSNASKEEIKRAYKKIALTCHPDKIKNDENKEAKIEKFKKASIAYKKLLADDDYDDYDDYDDWSLFEDLFDEKSLKSTLETITQTFFNNNIYPKTHYIPKDAKFHHTINVEVSYNEILTNYKKKLRLILVNIEEPIYIDINCGRFPIVIKEYIDDDNNLHEIILKMNIIKQEPFNHIINNDRIDIIQTIEITLLEFITGYQKNIKYIDGNTIEINVPPFQYEYFQLEKKGLKGGSFFVNITIKYLEKENWEKLTQIDKEIFISILKMI